MNTSSLITKASQVLFYGKDSLLCAMKMGLIHGYKVGIGRVALPTISECALWQHRISTEKLYSFCARIDAITKNPDAIVATLNELTTNKKELAIAYSSLVQQENGIHALPLFLEHFLPFVTDCLRDVLSKNGFTDDEIDEVVSEIATYHFEVVFAHTQTTGPTFLIETIPVFNERGTTAVFGGSIMTPVPVVFEIPGLENCNSKERAFATAKSIIFGERLEELAKEYGAAASPFIIDRAVIQEWISEKKPWVITSEKWILNFFSQLALNYVLATGIRNSNMVVIGDLSPCVSGDGQLIMN